MINGLAVLALLQAARPAPPVSPDSIVVLQPGPNYSAGWLRSLLFGDAWRALWTSPIRVAVTNLDSVAGGLTAYEKGGSAQTRGLRFRTPDGRLYYFRSVDKTATQGFTGLINNPPARWLAREQISAMFPAAALVVGELERTAGLLATERWLGVLPDSPRLGEWRQDFKGLLGVFERRQIEDNGEPPDIPGAAELVSSDTLLPRLKSDGLSWVDPSRYLTSRLFDVYVGDWDRHADQWSWVRFDRDGLRWWVPLPKDRDWALSRFDGLAWGLFRIAFPIWAKFDNHYGRLGGLTVRGEPLDRRFLTGVDRAAWSAAASSMRDALSDRAIDSAVAALPREYDAKAIAFLSSSLKARRDGLTDLADRFYRRLAGTVSIRGTDASEVVQVRREADGSLLLELVAQNRAPVYRRKFVPAETDEIRLYLGGGADTVRVHGSPRGIMIRVIAGGGPAIIADSTGGNRLRVYDASNSARVFATGSVPSIRSQPSSADPDELRRDWGNQFGFAPWIANRPELGLVLGGGPVLSHYGFRILPYQSQLTLRFATTTGRGPLNVDFRGDFRFERPDRRILVRAAALNADVIRYFGAGNATTRSTTEGFNNVTQQQFFLEPTFILGTHRGLRAELGGVARWSEQDADRVTLLDAEHPYGSGSFFETGATARLAYDSKDNPLVPTRGVTLELGGRLFPPAFDVQSWFGSAALVGTSYLSSPGLPLAPTLALRAAAVRVFGTYPYFEAATIGGRETLRGLTTRRFAGDAAVYGSSELRLSLGKLMGADVGVLGLADLGRVYLKGERSERWHTSAGGGLWVAFNHRQQQLTATLAKGGEHARFYVSTGFHF